MWRGSAVAAAAAIAAYAVYHHRRRRRASPSHPDKEATPDALDIGRVIVSDGDRAAAGSGSDSIDDIGRVISYWFDGDFSELLSTRWFVQHNSGAQRALDAHIAAEVSLALGLEPGEDPPSPHPHPFPRPHFPSSARCCGVRSGASSARGSRRRAAAWRSSCCSTR